MNQTVELPETVYTALRRAANARGITPAAWIAAHLPKPTALAPTEDAPEVAPGTVAERFAGRVGQIASGGRERLSEHTGERFGDHMEEKRRTGRL